VSRDDRDQQIADLERELHRLRCQRDALTEERDQAQAAARAWRRVAQWIHEANRPED
jgi:ribosomal protein L29